MPDQPVEGVEIQIELGDVSYKQTQQKRRPDSERAVAVVECGQASHEKIPVFIHEQALRGIEAHAASDLSVELGGALLGGFYRHGDRQFVEITDFIIAEEVEHTSAQITFTHDTWAQIDAERDSRAPGAQIVGWYHTHPDLGVFLSEPDTFIQRNFFKEPWQVAMVLDPVRGDRAFFQVKGGSLARMPGFHVVAAKGRRKALQAYADQLELVSRRRSESVSAPPVSSSGSGAITAWLLLLTLALAVVVVGEAVKGRPLLAPPQPGIQERAAASMRMGDYEEAERLYAQALLLRPREDTLVRSFRDARSRVEALPEVPPARQARFIKWFLREVDGMAAGDYATAEKLYNAAGVRIGGKPEDAAAWTQRDQEVLAAYRYLAEGDRMTRPGREKSSPGDDETSQKMQANVQRSWDAETVQKMQSGLKHLIEARPAERTELKKALDAIEKEYLLKKKPPSVPPSEGGMKTSLDPPYQGEMKGGLV